MGIASTNGVRCLLDALESKGYIERSRRTARGIGLPERLRGAPVDGMLVPIIGRIAAGTPVLAEQNIEDHLRLDPNFMPAVSGAFALRVRGDSMTGAGILSGDLVIIHPDPSPASGEVVVAYWDGEATVKRFYRSREGIQLRPENPKYAVIRITPDQEDFRVLGRVAGVVRRCS